MNELKEMVDLIPDDTKKEIYDDLAKPTLTETGRTLSIFPRVIKNALMKVEMWCLNREFAIEQFKIELAEKLEKIKEENIVDADPRIFIPSAQAISYSWDQEEIKKLYMNLIVSDMDKNTKEQVHPSFTEVIKQMDAVDVKLFSAIYHNEVFPMCRINRKSENGGLVAIVEYLLPDHFYLQSSENTIIKSLDNLERLKLISIKLDVTYTDKQHYLIIQNGERAKKYQSELGESFDIEEGVILKTEFGKDFFKICCE